MPLDALGAEGRPRSERPTARGRPGAVREDLLERLRAATGLAAEHIVATATALMAPSILRASRDFVDTTTPLAELGIAAAAKTELSFSIFGAFAFRGEPNTLARCTGASRAVVAGAVWYL